MNGSTSAVGLTNNTVSRGPDYLKPIRQLQMLLREAERALQHNPDIASTYLNEAIALLAAESKRACAVPKQGRLGSVANLACGRI